MVLQNMEYDELSKLITLTDSTSRIKIAELLNEVLKVLYTQEDASVSSDAETHNHNKLFIEHNYRELDGLHQMVCTENFTHTFREVVEQHKPRETEYWTSVLSKKLVEVDRYIVMAHIKSIYQALLKDLSQRSLDANTHWTTINGYMQCQLLESRVIYDKNKKYTLLKLNIAQYGQENNVKSHQQIRLHPCMQMDRDSMKSFVGEMKPKEVNGVIHYSYAYDDFDFYTDDEIETSTKCSLAGVEPEGNNYTLYMLAILRDIIESHFASINYFSEYQAAYPQEYVLQQMKQVFGENHEDSDLIDAINLYLLIREHLRDFCNDDLVETLLGVGYVEGVREVYLHLDEFNKMANSTLIKGIEEISEIIQGNKDLILKEWYEGFTQNRSTIQQYDIDDELDDEADDIAYEPKKDHDHIITSSEGDGENKEKEKKAKHFKTPGESFEWYVKRVMKEVFYKYKIAKAYEHGYSKDITLDIEAHNSDITKSSEDDPAQNNQQDSWIPNHRIIQTGAFISPHVGKTRINEN